MKKLLAVILSLSLMMGVLTACGDTTDGNSNAPSRDGSTFTVGIPNDLDSLDPYLMTAAGTREVMLNIYEGLVKVNSDGEYVCAVASDYTLSDDGLTYTFTLRDGVKFHNGDTVTTDDVLYSFDTCAATTVLSTVQAALSGITDIHADGNQIVIKLDKPNGDFIATISSVFIVPKDYEERSTAPIGTGPYKFVSRSIQENVILVRNDDYYGKKANIENVVIKVYEDSTAMVTALNSGSLDMVNHLTSSQIETLTNGYNVLSDNMNLVSALYLNNAVAPFDNELVRKAMNYAIDVDSVIDFASDGYGQKVGTSMYPNFTKYYDDEIAALADAYPYDPEKAKELLAEAGYADGFEFTIDVPSNYEHPYGDMAQVIAENLKEVGITANINYVDWNGYWLTEVYANRNFEATIVGFTANTLTASALLDRWNSDNKSNMINYNNPEYDATYAAAFASQDDAEATKLYKECLKILSDTAANVYIQDLGEFVVLHPQFSGYEFYPMYMIDLAAIEFEG